MTTFRDGPAKGQCLMIKRTPLYLRVVEQAGKWDALDQPYDSPKPAEKLYAYKCVELQGMVHIYRRGGGGGFYPRAEYALIPNQPADAVMRTNEAWVAWVEANATEADRAACGARHPGEIKEVAP